VADRNGPEFLCGLASLRAKYFFSFLFSQRRQAAKGLPACLPQAGRGGLDFKAT